MDYARGVLCGEVATLCVAAYCLHYICVVTDMPALPFAFDSECKTGAENGICGRKAAVTSSVVTLLVAYQPNS